MKKTGFLLALLWTAVAVGQQAPEATTVATAAAPDTSSSSQATAKETSKSTPTVQFATPTYADLYCAGFISKQLLPDANYVAGGLQTPNTTKFVTGDIIYLAGGGYTTGGQYTIVRELKDQNRYEVFPGQAKAVNSAGQPYGEIG